MYFNIDDYGDCGLIINADIEYDSDGRQKECDAKKLKRGTTYNISLEQKERRKKLDIERRNKKPKPKKTTYQQIAIENLKRLNH